MTVTRFSQASLSVPVKYRNLMAGSTTLSDYELISTTVLSSTASSVTFSGLGTSAAAYKHLQVRYTARLSNASNYFLFKLNGDSGSNYARHELTGNGSSVISDYGTSTPNPAVGLVASSADTASMFAGGIIDLLDFNSTSKYKTLRGLSGKSNIVSLRSLLWMNTAAVTSIDLAGPVGGYDFVSGSRFSLYGLK